MNIPKTLIAALVVTSCVAPTPIPDVTIPIPPKPKIAATSTPPVVTKQRVDNRRVETAESAYVTLHIKYGPTKGVPNGVIMHVRRGDVEGQCTIVNRYCEVDMLVPRDPTGYYGINERAEGIDFKAVTILYNVDIK